MTTDDTDSDRLVDAIHAVARELHTANLIALATATSPVVLSGSINPAVRDRDTREVYLDEARRLTATAEEWRP